MKNPISLLLSVLITGSAFFWPTIYWMPPFFRFNIVQAAERPSAEPQRHPQPQYDIEGLYEFFDEEEIEPEIRNPATSNVSRNENLNLKREAMPYVCPESSSAHALFMRPDLAYSVTGVDCYGDVPKSEITTARNEVTTGRVPATGTYCRDEPYAHASGLRPDLAYSETGIDCQGAKPGDTVESLAHPIMVEPGR